MNEAVSPATVIEGEAAAALMQPLTDLVIRAGAAILAVNRAAMRIEGKLDGSPVTEADLAADRIIAEGLARLAPQVPALSEERVSSAKPPYNGSFFLIDPLDGTKEFVAGRDEFTVNLALVTNGTPLLGIVGAPALGLVWRGLVGRGAERLTVRRKLGGRADPYPAPARGAASPGSSPSAARMATAAPKPSSRRDPARSARRSARRSNSAGWRRGKPISIPALRRHPNGISRPATRSSPPPAAGSRMRRAASCNSGGAGPASSCRNSSPGAIRRRWDRPSPRNADCHGPGMMSFGDFEAARYCARSCSSAGQRAFASRRTRPGSAAKASRLFSRLNR